MILTFEIPQEKVSELSKGLWSPCDTRRHSQGPVSSSEVLSMGHLKNPANEHLPRNTYFIYSQNRHSAYICSSPDILNLTQIKPYWDRSVPRKTRGSWIWFSIFFEEDRAKQMATIIFFQAQACTPVLLCFPVWGTE